MADLSYEEIILICGVKFVAYPTIKQTKILSQWIGCSRVIYNCKVQECAVYSHTHPDNRKSQKDFTCLSCGNHDNADLNAAKVIAKRGVQFILSRPKAKTKTSLGISRSKAGQGISKTKLDLSNPLIPMIPEALWSFRAE